MGDFFQTNIWNIIQAFGVAITLIFSVAAFVQSRFSNKIAKASNLKADESNKIADEAKKISLIELAPAVIGERIKVTSKNWYELRNETTFDFQNILLDSDEADNEYDIIGLELINKGRGIVTEITIDKILFYNGNEYSVQTDEENPVYIYNDTLKCTKDILIIPDGKVEINILYINKYTNLMDFIEEVENGVLQLDLTIKTINNVTYIETYICYYSITDINEIIIDRKTIKVEVVS